jgi:protein-disulfide isomerase
VADGTVLVVPAADRTVLVVSVVDGTVPRVRRRLGGFRLWRRIGGDVTRDTGDGRNEVTRRGCLTAVAATGSVAVAGCLGESSGTSYDCGDSSETVSQAAQPAIGAADAPVTVKVWEDFACPHCKTFSLEVFPRIREQYVATGDVRFEHHDFPIPVREWAWGAASASRAVSEATDGETFFAYAKSLYEAQDDYSLQAVGDAADSLDGVDPCAAVTAARSETYRPVIEADRERGAQLGVEGTPSVFVNGGAVTDGYGFDAVSAAIERHR